jgi:sugar/nucleoside kinase (ribokinase family)
LDFDYNLSEFKGIPYIYVSSISAPKWPEIMDKVCFLVKGGAKLAWNPSNVQLKAGVKKLSKYLKNVYILSINEDEARELVLSKNKVNGFRLKFLLKEIFKMGPKIIVITMGPKGAVAYDGKNFYHQKAAPSKVVHTTGAGDSFTAAFVASLIYKPSDMQRAMKWGMINSASVINYVGAQKGLLTQKEILKRYDF